MMNIFKANTNAGSVAYYKTDATSRGLGQRKQAVAPQYRIYDTPKETAKVVETFGIVDREGYTITTGFKVSDSRKDKTTGVVQPGQGSQYGADLFTSMFAGWN